jgi:regulator of sirC expression with transglutaminase-like and TPR domain
VIEPSDPETSLRAFATCADARIDLADAALRLAALDRPRARLERYQRHLEAVARDVGQAVGTAGDNPTLAQRVSALAGVIATQFGYLGDSFTYDDPQNANLMRVIDRRKGLPVSLGIIFIHAARAQGWQAAGINFPGHFLVRLDHEGRRAIIDPFHGGRQYDARGLRDLLKQTAAADAELHPIHFETVGNRDTLLRLQNNIKRRCMENGDFARAAEVIGRMLMFAPKQAKLWSDAATCHSRLGNLAAATEALEQFLALCDSDTARHDAATLLQRLRTQLN